MVMNESKTKLTKETADELMKIKGEARGMTLKTDWEFILLQEKEQGLKKLEARMAELGYPLEYKKIRGMDFYPLGFDVLSLRVIEELFHYRQEDFQRLGAYASKLSLLLKIFVKYFPSPQLLIRQAPALWRKHYTVGDLEIIKIDEEKKEAIVRLENFNIHRLYCYTMMGYFTAVLQIFIGQPIKVKETKCGLEGGEYHEFLLEW